MAHVSKRIVSGVSTLLHEDDMGEHQDNQDHQIFLHTKLVDLNKWDNHPQVKKNAAGPPIGFEA